MAKQSISLTATTTLTRKRHANTQLLMGASGAALTFTLPAPTGSGDKYLFVVSVVNTSNYIIKASAGTELFKGTILMASTSDSATDAVNSWTNGSTDDTLTFDGTTTGGVTIGDWVELTDCSPTLWMVRGVMTQSGTEATPFSDTVT